MSDHDCPIELKAFMLALLLLPVVACASCSGKGRGNYVKKEPGEKYPNCRLYYDEEDKSAVLKGKSFAQAYRLFTEIRQVALEEGVTVDPGSHKKRPVCRLEFYTEAEGRDPKEYVWYESMGVFLAESRPRSQVAVTLNGWTHVVLDKSYRQRIEDFLKTVDWSRPVP